MKKLIFLLFSVIVPLIMTAQVQLMDLSVIPKVSVNNSSDTTNLLIQFKMHPASQVQSIEFLFGTQAGQGDVFSDTATVLQQGQIFMVSYGNQQIPIRNYEAQINCSITQTQNIEWENLTVYVTSHGGTQFGPLTWSKQTGN
ncbi:MAG: hypothetical protein ABIJ97_01630 [Bacteroidota bacterium]